MQRLLAILLLSLIGFLPLAPAISAAAMPASALPACCRSQGKHKCALHSTGQPAIYSACQQGPVLPPAASTASNTWVFLPQVAKVFAASLVNHPSAESQAEALFRISFERSRHKRGPPTFFS